MATKTVARVGFGGFILLGLVTLWAALMSPARPELSSINFGQNVEAPEVVKLDVPDTVVHEKGVKGEAVGKLAKASIVITWKPTSVGCNYHISLKKTSSPTEGFDHRTSQKCHPRDLLNFLKSLEVQIKRHLGERGGEIYKELATWLEDILFPPF